MYYFLFLLFNPKSKITYEKFVENYIEEDALKEGGWGEVHK